MPVTTYDECRTSRQSAFDVDVILRIGQERPETKPGGHEKSPAENRVQHRADLVLTYPRVITENSFPLQNVLILQGHGG